MFFSYKLKFVVHRLILFFMAKYRFRALFTPAFPLGRVAWDPRLQPTGLADLCWGIFMAETLWLGSFYSDKWLAI